MCSPLLRTSAVTSMPIFGFCARRRPAGGQSKDLRDARAALQQEAQDDGLTRWGVVDHVPHPGQNRQPRRLRVACHRWLQWLPLHLEEANGLAGLFSPRRRTDTCVVRCSSVADPLAMLRPPGHQDLRIHRVLVCVQRVKALVLGIEHAPPHHRVEAAQGSDQQVQAVGADRRLIRRLHEPALDRACSERTAGLEQEQPRVLTNSLRPSVPLVAMLGQESEPRPQHGQVGLARSRGTDTLHEAIPLVERDDQLPVASNTSRS